MDTSHKHICPHLLNKRHDYMRINRMKAEAEEENTPHHCLNEKGLQR